MNDTSQRSNKLHSLVQTIKFLLWEYHRVNNMFINIIDAQHGILSAQGTDWIELMSPNKWLFILGNLHRLEIRCPPFRRDC